MTEKDMNEALEVIWDKYRAAIMDVLAKLDYCEFYYYYVVGVEFPSYTGVNGVQFLEQKFETGINLIKHKQI